MMIICWVVMRLYESFLYCITKAEKFKKKRLPFTVFVP